MSEVSVLELGPDPRYWALAFGDDVLGRLSDARRGSWASWWSSMRADAVRVADDVREPLVGTAPWNNSVQVMTVASTIKNVCEDILGDYGEFLPVETDQGLFWAFHCLNEAHALDEENTERMRWVQDASIPGGRRLLFAFNLRFIEAVAREARVFVLPEDNGRGTIYFTPGVINELEGIPGGFTGASWRVPV